MPQLWQTNPLTWHAPHPGERELFLVGKDPKHRGVKHATTWRLDHWWSMSTLETSTLLFFAPCRLQSHNAFANLLPRIGSSDHSNHDHLNADPESLRSALVSPNSSSMHFLGVVALLCLFSCSFETYKPANQSLSAHYVFYLLSLLLSMAYSIIQYHHHYCIIITIIIIWWYHKCHCHTMLLLVRVIISFPCCHILYVHTYMHYMRRTKHHIQAFYVLY